MRLPIRGLAALCLGAAMLAGQPAGAQELSAEQRAAFEAVIQDYLRAHPEVVVDALALYDKQQAEAEAARQREEVIAQAEEIYRRPGSGVMGNPEGDVTLVEFFDYQCGFCKRVVEGVFQMTGDDPSLRVVFKEFPILGPLSVVAARAALASRAQGLYVEYHNAMMTFRGTLTEDIIFGTAASVGLDVDRLRRDMESPEVQAEIDANYALAEALGIRGTPAFVIGEQVIPGAVPMETLKNAIDGERAG